MLHKKLIKLARNLICVVGFILISPFLFFAALGLLLEDGLPVLFVQDRIGQNKKIFKIIKIRTLKTGTPHTGKPSSSNNPKAAKNKKGEIRINPTTQIKFLASLINFLCNIL